jgi:long-chain acyl-CoA synthetase
MHLIEDTGVDLGVRAGDERLAVLPMCDPTERVLGLYLALKHRIISNYLENPETATENLREVKPTVFGADCEAWERLHARTTALAAGATGVQRMLYRWAIGGGGGVLANVLVLSAIRGQLGFGKLRVAYVGDHALSAEIAAWASALGITVRYINPFQKGETHA